MQVTKAIKEKAAAVAKQHKLTEIYVNNKGEFFSAENAASISVNGKKEDFARIAVNTVVVNDDKKQDEK